MNREELLKDLFAELEGKAYNAEYHNYYYKEANQVIRAFFERTLPPAEGADPKKVQWSGYGELGNISQKPLQPTAEGAEEILEDIAMRIDASGVGNNRDAIKRFYRDKLNTLATLHAQRIADKMVEENWININDRMPESGFCVLLYSESGGVAEGAWSDSNGYFEQWRWSAILSDVTHWMPLPNPPIK